MRLLQAFWPFATGVLFSVGLCVSGMTQPAKVIGFLDIFGAWDPSLGLVMAGAVGVYALAHQLSRRSASPWLGAAFPPPSSIRVDARLLGGAAIFGVGWGLGGFCPGPALSAFGAGTRAALWFVPAMVLGVALCDALDRRAVRRRSANGDG